MHERPEHRQPLCAERSDQAGEAALDCRDAITQNLSTLRNRINALGVSEPLIQQQGENHIVVDLAGVQDPTEAKKLIGAMATLQYRPGIGYAGDAAAQEAARTGNVPPDANLYYMRGTHAPVLVKKKIIVTGDELVDANSGIDSRSGTPNVSVTLNATGAKKMLDFTSANVGKPMAVVYVERTPTARWSTARKCARPR